MKQTKLCVILIFLITLISCNDLKFDGNVFYSVQGRIIDKDSDPLKGCKLNILHESLYDDIFTASHRVYSQTGLTDEDGRFELFFPKSTGITYLEIENVNIKDETNNDSLHNIILKKLIKLNLDSCNNFKYNLNNIMVFSL